MHEPPGPGRRPNVPYEDEEGWHHWQLISDTLAQMITTHPEYAVSIIASQSPGSFDPEDVRRIEWTRCDFLPGQVWAHVVVAKVSHLES